MVSLVLEQFNIGARTILLGVQNFLRGVFRDAVYPKDIWHGDATYPRIFCRGVPKIGGVEYPMTPVDATYPRIFCRGVPKIGGVEYPMTPAWDLCIYSWL